MKTRLAITVLAFCLLCVGSASAQYQFKPAIDAPPNYTPRPTPTGFQPITAPKTIGAQPAQQELQRLRALLVMDTESNLNKCIEVERETIRGLLTRGVPANRLDVTILQGRDANPERVLEYYRNLQTNHNEAILFFYAGHGAFEATPGRASRHKLAMTHGWLDREDLIQAMRAKNAGLTILLTDCCSNVYTVQNANQVATNDTSFGQARNLQPLCRNLFFQHRGLVDITAASYGQFAWFDTEVGGWFGAAIGRVFNAPGNCLPNGGRDFVTWDTFHSSMNGQLLQSYSWPRGKLIQTAFRFPR